MGGGIQESVILADSALVVQPLPFLTEEVPLEGQKARNAVRTTNVYQSRVAQSTYLTIFVAIFFTNKII